MVKRSSSQVPQESKRQKNVDLFYQDDEDLEDEDESFMDEDEWEDVPLDGVHISVPKPERQETTKIKRKSPPQYQRLKYGLHIACIPFMLKLLKERSMWVQDERLNRRLRRSVPKTIVQRYEKWTEEKDFEKLGTLLLGLVFWFRSHYQINSNGFRQNFNRLQYLLKYCDDEKKSQLYADVLNHQDWFYGQRPICEGGLEDIRLMAKNKKSNRDILVVFFCIIIKNLLPKDTRISLCFALPLHDYEVSCNNVKWQMKNGVGRVPDRFDTDLLLPYFWLELRFPERSHEFYVIDPVVHPKQKEIVTRHNEDEPVTHFQPYMDVKLNYKQRFHYVVSVECNSGVMQDVSPRYLPNLWYRYFKPRPSTIISKSLHRKSYDVFMKFLRRYPIRNSSSMELIATKHYFIPTTLVELKRSPCFVIPSLLKRNETLRFECSRVATFRKEPVFLRCDVILLKSRQHWAQLGRSVKSDAKPLKYKKYVSLKRKRQRSLDPYEVRELFSIEQTVPTPKLPSTYRDQNGQERAITDVDFYRNEFNHVEIYSPTTIPDGFHLLPIKTKSCIKHLNKKCQRLGQSKIKYVEVVSGFDFRQKPGYAMPKIQDLMVSSHDYYRTTSFLKIWDQLTGLSHWKEFLTNLQIHRRLDDVYGRLEESL
ncbi:hypothetical protein ZYGR_0I06020 [Zygosaccharomyces rouxii]|uniref:DNA repair protein RAD34 n=1 Tax=Zygosaccharomyces rouxii TaxID=4956 RepID=A0A1Q2ZY11_ZYGRO|nr:hypothetical protein ZYGR_0I06020 [Zygosaccharomyces rouxii]